MQRGSLTRAEWPPLPRPSPASALTTPALGQGPPVMPGLAPAGVATVLLCWFCPRGRPPASTVPLTAPMVPRRHEKWPTMLAGAQLQRRARTFGFQNVLTLRRSIHRTDALCKQGNVGNVPFPTAAMPGSRPQSGQHEPRQATSAAKLGAAHTSRQAAAPGGRPPWRRGWRRPARATRV